MHDDELIARHIELDSFRPWPGDARLRGSGVHVWALVGYYLNAVDEDATRVAHDYDVPLKEVEAALAYYRRHKCEIDARLAQNAPPSVA
jgi:uncharacterized protein (DUF433 family)